MDEKNIRRRVYDAINVLLALNVISKERKAIKWRGLPQLAGPPPQQAGAAGAPPRNDPAAAGGRAAEGEDAIAWHLRTLHAEVAALSAAVERKAQALSDLAEQRAALRGLLDRNARRRAGGAPPRGTALPLPFLLVQARPDATVEVQISDDMRDVTFDFFAEPFQLYDDAFVLRQMKGAGAVG